MDKKPIVVFPKGRLYKELKKHFESRGISMPDENTRQYFYKDWRPDCSLFLAKPKAIPSLLYTGIADYGFCGRDIIANSEYDNQFDTVGYTGFNMIRICLCSRMTMDELMNLKRPVIVATEFDIIASHYFTQLGIPHYILNTAGSTEGYLDINADCIIDVVDTGETLRKNNIQILDQIMVSDTRLFTKKDNHAVMPLSLSGEYSSNKHSGKYIKHIVEIDGNDGTGKSFLIKNILSGEKQEAFKHVLFGDRGLLSTLTLDPYYNQILEDPDNIVYHNIVNNSGVKRILIDADIETCQKNILERGDSLDEQYHTKEDLALYRERFLKLAEIFNIPIINGNETDINKKIDKLYEYINN